MKLTIFFLLLFTPCIIAARGINTEKPDTCENLWNQVRFFGIDYKMSTLQTAVSDKYNLTGIETFFSSFNTDLSYPWFLDKKKQNSILLAKASYSNLKIKSEIDKSEQQRILSNIPEYIYTIPTIHNFAINLIFIQSFKKNWDFTASYNLIVSSDLKSFIQKDDFNSVGLFYFQKKVRNFKFGAGSAIYVIDKKLKALPLLSIGFSNKKMNLELLPPLSLNTQFRIGRKSVLGFGADVIMSGFNVDYTTSNFQDFNSPDYINYSGIDISLSFDRKFYETLRWKIGTGYSYREIDYRRNNNSIGKLVFWNALFFKFLFYSTF